MSSIQEGAGSPLMLIKTAFPLWGSESGGGMEWIRRDREKLWHAV